MILNSRVEDTHFPKNRHLKLGDKLVDLSLPKVMGILNLNSDSFYKKSRINSDSELLVACEKMISDGADILDIGATSSRPGALISDPEEERTKIIASVSLIRKEFPDTILSLDTYHSSVAEAGLDKGIDIINDISGGQIDDKMFSIVGKYKAPYILTHMKGTPENMQHNPEYENVFTEVTRYFSEKIAVLKEAGVNDIILDPGIGFGKTIEQNFELLNALDQFQLFGQPILIGISRKSLIYKKLNISPEESLNGSTALNSLALLKGASILRVHDIKEAKEIISLFN